MNLRILSLAAASGLLLSLAFPAADLYPLVWISLVPLQIAIHNKPPKDAFRIGSTMGLVFFFIEIRWLVDTFHVHGGLSLIVSLLATAMIAAYFALYPALYCSAVTRLRGMRPLLFLIASSVIWVSLEFARASLFGGLPWSLLGYSQYKALPVIQIADLTGVYGISFLIVMANTALAGFITDGKQWRGIAVTTFLFLLVLGYGFSRLNTTERAPVFTISVIQGNIEQDRKWDPVYQSSTISSYRQLTRDALTSNPGLLIWPETATPFYFLGSNPADRALSADLIAFERSNNVPLLFGSPTIRKKSEQSTILRNSAFLLSNKGEVIGRYDKVHLVPFGEYVPFRSVLFFAGKMVKSVGDFEPGEDHTILILPGDGPSSLPVKLGTAICYEIIFPDLVRQFVNHGASMITTITNDAWFGKSAAPYQHFSIAVFRAIENRVPVARAANTGVSGFIDAQGHILAATDIFTEAYLTKALAPGSTITFYTRHGDLFAWFCVFFSFFLLLKAPVINSSVDDFSPR